MIFVRRVLTIGAVGVIAGAAAVTITRITGITATPLVQLVAYAHLVTIVYVTAAIVLVLARHRWAASVPGALALVHVAWLVPLLTSGGPNGPRAGTLRVLTVNAHVGQADPAGIVALVRRERVDVLAVQEPRPGLAAVIDARLRASHPHRLRNGTFERGGVGLWSRRALQETSVVGSADLRMPQATIIAAGHPVRLTGVHTTPPVPSRIAGWRDDLTVLADRRPARGERAIMLGDFNATLDHRAFRSVLASGWRDGGDEAGSGLAGTWRNGGRLGPVVRLDHVLVAGALRVTATSVHDIERSDHRAVLAEVAILADG